MLAHVRGFADAEQDPVHFTTAPAAAVPRALAAAGLAAGDVDFYEARPSQGAASLRCRHSPLSAGAAGLGTG